MLAEMGLRRSIRDQAIGFVPAKFPDCRDGSPFSFTIALGTNLVSELGLQPYGVAKRLNILQGNNGGAAVLIPRRHAERKIFSPINERPPRYLPD